MPGWEAACLPGMGTPCLLPWVPWKKCGMQIGKINRLYVIQIQPITKPIRIYKHVYEENKNKSSFLNSFYYHPMNIILNIVQKSQGDAVASEMGYGKEILDVNPSSALKLTGWPQPCMPQKVVVIIKWREWDYICFPEPFENGWNRNWIHINTTEFFETVDSYIGNHLCSMDAISYLLATFLIQPYYSCNLWLSASQFHLRSSGFFSH